jgi:hypothetical protein
LFPLLFDRLSGVAKPSRSERPEFDNVRGLFFADQSSLTRMIGANTPEFWEQSFETEVGGEFHLRESLMQDYGQ